MQNLNRGQLLNLFSDLGIHYKDKSQQKFPMLCPFHGGKSYGNCDFNLELQRGFCFSCKTSFNAITLTRHMKGYASNKEAYRYLKDTYGLTDSNREDSSFAGRKLIPDVPRVEALKQKSITEIKTLPIKVEDYQYLMERRVPQEWIDKFYGRICISGFYKYYMVTPIQDADKYVNTFEARRIQEFELFPKILNVPSSNLKRLKAMFSSYLNKNQIKIDDYALTMNGNPLDNPMLYHCLLPKVFYPGASLTTKPLIWNEKNLDRTQPLWLCEGMGSVPRIWNEVSNNVSCTFGSLVSEYQIEVLNEFPQINLIVDDDIAGFQMFMFLKNSLIIPLRIADTMLEDKDKNFSEEILSKPLLHPYSYLSRFDKTLQSLVVI